MDLIPGLQEFSEVMTRDNFGVMVRLKKCWCGKMLKEHEHAVKRHSGNINYIETLCDDCRKELSAYARIICIKCRSLRAFVTPERMNTGFVFERGKHYHVAQCPQCMPSATDSCVLEHEQFCKARGIKTQRNMDLVQEIEQKNLQDSGRGIQFGSR